eukprot:g4734.t1
MVRMASRSYLSTAATPPRTAPRRKPFVGGNWKCNGTLNAASDLVELLNASSSSFSAEVDVVVAPPSLHIVPVRTSLTPSIGVSSQDVNYEENGAHTGEISASMLVDAGVTHAIVGHSERRAGGESDAIVGLKAARALHSSLSVIACLGETFEERESGSTLDVVFRQLEAYVDALSWDAKHVVLAYEPVWAIGTGLTASPEQAQEVHAALREWLRANVSDEAADGTRIIYGGSVGASNAEALGAMSDIDGFLVGGASLKKDFVGILQSFRACD